jgi:hypothetical protein
MTAVTATPVHAETRDWRGISLQLAPFLGILTAAMILPFVSNDYWALIGTRAAIYWVLVSGLNLIVGFAGHLAIGYVALLTLGAYTTSVLVAGNVMPPLDVFASLAIAGAVGAVFGVVVGLPAYLLFRDVDARLRDHRRPDRTRLAERHRRRHRHRGSGIPRALQYRLGLLLPLRRLCGRVYLALRKHRAQQVRPRADRHS